MECLNVQRHLHYKTFHLIDDITDLETEPAKPEPAHSAERSGELHGSCTSCPQREVRGACLGRRGACAKGAAGGLRVRLDWFAREHCCPSQVFASTCGMEGIGASEAYLARTWPTRCLPSHAPPPLPRLALPASLHGQLTQRPSSSPLPFMLQEFVSNQERQRCYRAKVRQTLPAPHQWGLAGSCLSHPLPHFTCTPPPKERLTTSLCEQLTCQPSGSPLPSMPQELTSAWEGQQCSCASLRRLASFLPVRLGWLMPELPTAPLQMCTCLPKQGLSTSLCGQFACKPSSSPLPSALQMHTCTQEGQWCSRASPWSLAGFPPPRLGWLVPEPPTVPLCMPIPPGEPKHFPLQAAHMQAIHFPTFLCAVGIHKHLGRAAGGWRLDKPQPPQKW